ncbi:MAG: bifunctional diguanylate cyclase/phosphodiesterase [Myxococcales bacterium]|nr:bifunctional diguanylate cyclase/phosphodiesterase [Myxococcales bacterium]
MPQMDPVVRSPFGGQRGAYAASLAVLAAAATLVLWTSREGNETLRLFTALGLGLGAGLIVGSQSRATHREDVHRDGPVTHDPVTTLLDRHAFELALSDAAVRRHRAANYAAVLKLDLDDFRDINDELGMKVGDHVLRTVGDRLQASLRDGDVASRLGADEFAILLTSLAQPDDAERVAMRIQAQLRLPIPALPEGHIVSSTIGIAVQPLRDLDSETLLKNASLALRLAKCDARGGSHVFVDSMRAGLERRRKLEAALRRHSPKETFTLAYQPKVDLDRTSGGVLSAETGAGPFGTVRIIGFEALLRWTDPQLGFISPAEFIPILEETGLIVEVGAFVLDTACGTLASFQRTFSRPDLTMAVNLSTRQLQDPHLVGVVSDILRAHGLAPACLELEVTESMLMEKPDRAIAILEALRSEGVRISVDDFGTGYSSLQYLKRLPISTIKVDRSFVMSLPCENDMAIVRATVNLGKSLGLTVVAEGVEKDDQLALLRQFGCDHAQGFLFSRPLPLADAEQLLDRERR